MLAYVCNSARVYFWTPEKGAYWSDLPPLLAQLAVQQLTWSNDGLKILLQGRESLSLLTVNPNDEFPDMGTTSSSSGNASGVASAQSNPTVFDSMSVF